MKRFFLFSAILGLIGGHSVTHAADNGSNVVVVYNTREPESRGVADHYALMRHVPASQILGLDLPDVELIGRGDFRERLQKPLLKAFEEHGWFHFETQS